MLMQQFQQYVKDNFNHLSAPGFKLLLAVSGGIDSTVMTDLFYKAGFDFIIAHCNFGLRGAESARDELFTFALGETYNKEVLVKRFDTNAFAGEKKISLQEAARTLRYKWFEEVSQHRALNATATAHNADDNVETMLMFLFRGTGIHGLTGINAFDKERKIIRPLLFATRKEIQKYAEQNMLGWVEDSSNTTDKYTRNFFRHTIIPAVEAHFPNAKNNLLESIHHLEEAELLYKEMIGLKKKKLLEQRGTEIHIPILKLKKSKPFDTVLWEIVKPYNFHSRQIEEIKKLCDAGNSSYVQSSSHRIIKNRNWLIIAFNESERTEHILIEENDRQVIFYNGVLHFELAEVPGYKLSVQKTVAQFDAKYLEYPLLLRKWKQGDYFYPFGMAKKKKLSRFFIDEKLSATAKENTWVLEMNKKILWVIGHRIDDRFKINASTKKILKITFASS
jgi:tRNA(Ile)-lysidine synthase